MVISHLPLLIKLWCSLLTMEMWDLIHLLQPLQTRSGQILASTSQQFLVLRKPDITNWIVVKRPPGLIHAFLNSREDKLQILAAFSWFAKLLKYVEVDSSYWLWTKKIIGLTVKYSQTESIDSCRVQQAQLHNTDILAPYKADMAKVLPISCLFTDLNPKQLVERRQ